MSAWHKNFKNDAVLAHLTRNPASEPKVSTGLNPSLDARLKYVAIATMFDGFFRLVPRIPFITDKFIGNDKIQAAALRYYLKKTLNESPSISALRRKLNFDLDKGNLPLNSQTRARLREITNEVQQSEAQMDELAENLIKNSDENANLIQNLENSAQFGRDMFILGEENLNGDIVKWALQNNKRIAVNKLNAQKAQELGFKHPDDVRRTIGADEIRHTLSRHGENSELVKKSGQPPVNENDIANYQKISDNADETLKSLDNSGNLVEVSFKQVNGYFVVVEQVRNKNNEFSFKTMFKGNGTYKNSEAYTKTAEKAQTLSQGYEPSANSFAQSADEIIPNSNSQSQVPQKSLLEQIKEKEAELMRLKEMAKNTDENTQKQGLNADESLTKKENERFEEVLEKPAQKETQNEPTQDIDKALKAQDEPKETPSIEKESLQLDEMPSQKVNKLFDEILTPNYYQNEKAVFYENMIKNAEKMAQNDKSVTSDNIKAMLNTNERVVIDKLDTQEALNLGFKNYENVKRTIDSDEIRHALKEHGEKSESAKNGKPFIDENDIANYPQITKTADEQLITKTKQNLPARVSFKQINGYYVVVEEVHNGQGELAFKTMFKENGDYQNSNVYKQATANPLFSHKTQGGNSLGSNEIIPNSKGQSQATNEQEPKILSEMQRIQNYALMKDLPEPTPAQQKKINTLKSMLEKRQNELKEVQDKIDKMPNAFSRFNSNNTKRAREKSLHNKKKALNLKIQDIKEQLAKIDNTMPKNERYFADKGEVWNNSMKAQMRDLEPISDYELAKKSLLKYENTIKAREWAEFYYNTQPLKEFGTNYAEFYRDGQGAVKKLLAEKQGQVAGAFYRQDLGDIDLIWGKSSGANDKGAYGLAHIIDKHGDEFAKFGGETRDEQISNALSEIIAKGKILPHGTDKINIEYNGFLIGLNKGFYENGVRSGENRWVVTAYDDNLTKAEKTAKSAPADDFTSEPRLSQNSN